MGVVGSSETGGSAGADSAGTGSDGSVEVAGASAGEAAGGLGVAR